MRVPAPDESSAGAQEAPDGVIDGLRQLLQVGLVLSGRERFVSLRACEWGILVPFAGRG
jgi:hypothetical protein